MPRAKRDLWANCARFEGYIRRVIELYQHIDQLTIKSGKNPMIVGSIILFLFDSVAASCCYHENARKVWSHFALEHSIDSTSVKKRKELYSSYLAPGCYNSRQYEFQMEAKPSKNESKKSAVKSGKCTQCRKASSQSVLLGKSPNLYMCCVWQRSLKAQAMLTVQKRELLLKRVSKIWTGRSIKKYARRSHHQHPTVTLTYLKKKAS